MVEFTQIKVELYSLHVADNLDTIPHHKQTGIAWAEFHICDICALLVTFLRKVKE